MNLLETSTTAIVNAAMQVICNDFDTTDESDAEYICEVENRLTKAIQRYLLYVISDAAQQKGRYYIVPAWSHKVNGSECGMVYITHYAVNLFQEMINKRYDKSNKLGLVNKLSARLVKKRLAYDKSTAMKMAYTIVRKQTRIAGTINEELNTLIEAINMKQGEAIRHMYPCLQVDTHGKYTSPPKDNYILLVAKLTIIFAEATGYN